MKALILMLTLGAATSWAERPTGRYICEGCEEKTSFVFDGKTAKYQVDTKTTKFSVEIVEEGLLRLTDPESGTVFNLQILPAGELYFRQKMFRKR